MGIISRIASPFSSWISSKSKRKSNRETARAKARVSKSELSEKERIAQRNPYRAISIDFDESCCDAMKAIGKKKFLVAQDKTPLLPLSGCDAAKCSCRYVHLTDRRDEEDERRHVGSLRTDLYEHSREGDRRLKNRGRRTTDR